jgi:hypothetical protein
LSWTEFGADFKVPRLNGLLFPKRFAVALEKMYAKLLGSYAKQLSPIFLYGDAAVDCLWLLTAFSSSTEPATHMMCPEFSYFLNDLARETNNLISPML